MSVEIPFRRDFSFEYGRLEPVAPMIRRIVARNPSPFTFKGTGTYIVGNGDVAVIDPGPDIAEHVDALVAGLSSERVTHILITHTHRDHSPAARALQTATGAPTYGFGPHAGGKRGDPAVEEGGDWDFAPDVTLRDGDRVAGKGWTFEAVHTPGHTSNHLCFALADAGVLFSGDHVMGWSTSVIAPPDMAQRLPNRTSTSEPLLPTVANAKPAFSTACGPGWNGSMQSSRSFMSGSSQGSAVRQGAPSTHTWSIS